MAKSQSFADKVNKKSDSGKIVCPVCETEVQRVKSIRSVPGKSDGSWKFRQKMVDVCKCNEKEVYALQ